MQGKVTKIFSDFYYVSTSKGIIECKMREVLKKSGVKVVVGDNVVIESFQKISNQAAICEILERKNTILRPNVANIDIIIIVISLKHPKTSLNSLDRYLMQAHYFDITPVICVNKTDLIEENDRENFCNIYKKSGYDIVFTSAKEHIGIENLKKCFKGKTALFSGPSGVGKTSLCNEINENIILKTGEVSKNTRGSHTTRHSEIISFNVENKLSHIVDTPGFSLLKFDYIEPQNVKFFFPEILKLSEKCKFSNCLHESEADCNVLKNMDKISESRYKSYLEILSEAKEYKKKIQEQGIKKEERSKKINSKFVPKISVKNRNDSRRKIKQQLNSDIGDY